MFVWTDAIVADQWRRKPEGDGPECKVGFEQMSLTKQSSRVPLEDIFRFVNSHQSTFESAPMHAFRLADVIADHAMIAESPS
jgi:hypothetical protein